MGDEGEGKRRGPGWEEELRRRMRGERKKGEFAHCVGAILLTSKVADTGGELQWLRLCSLLAHRLRVQLQREAHLSVYLTASAAMIDEPARQ